MERLPLEGWRRLFASFFGSGLIPGAPGTWGSIAAVLPLLFLSPTLWPALPLIGAVLATLLCVPLQRSLPAGRKDPGAFVLDEAAGVWLAVAIPAPTLWELLAGLALFRLFDITKPWPVKRLEAVGGGWGIVLDDLAAGAIALAILLCARSFLS